jgi:intracellular septation protein
VQTKLATKLAIEFTPLGLFFVTGATVGGFMWPTGVLVITTALSLILMWRLYDQLALMALISGLTGIIAGSATLIAHNDTYVQLKPSIISGLFALFLLVGALTGKQTFKMLLGRTLHLTTKGWHILTWLWFFYFLFVVALNEYVWRHYSFEVWMNVKVLVLMPLTVLFALSQIRLVRKHRLPDEDDALIPEKKKVMKEEKALKPTKHGAGPTCSNPAVARQP